MLMIILFRIRLQEGFNFAHTYSGIVNLVAELSMEVGFGCKVFLKLLNVFCSGREAISSG
jgi:hypothetical protein